jgi:hypothetical protein
MAAIEGFSAVKDLTDRELLDAIQDGLRQVAEQFRAKREAEARGEPDQTLSEPKVRSAA